MDGPPLFSAAISKRVKTNAARILDALGIRYELREYEVDPDDLSAETVARKVELPAEQVWKTLVVRGDRTGVLLAVVPGDAELDLKALARATGLPIAIPGGKHRGTLSEAELTRRFVEDELHYPVAVTEHASLDTRQNALNLVEPLRARHVDTVVLVTDARHMPRAD